jgi:3-deoxy-manno-octulosonate cytidylyltransferase (CMP-KDO synthetase)
MPQLENIKPKVIGVIPARFGSTRFPGKPLVKIGNKTMVHWTYQSSKSCNLLDQVIVATDDERIQQEVESFGGEVILTRTDHATGTDRLIEVANKLKENINSKQDIIVNIQGDEPGIESILIEGVVNLKLSKPQWAMTTAAVPMLIEDAKDPNRVKVVFTHEGKALYFSRSMIPFPLNANADGYQYFRHLGIYCYNFDFLLNYNQLPKSSLEQIESLEQLRAMEAGYDIGIFLTDKATLSIDQPDDVALVEKDFRTKGWIGCL